MKANIHPQWFSEANVVCACGNTWKTGATVPEIRTDICSACHPFYTGEQRIVDTEGQVDRFYKKLQVRKQYLEDQQAREAARTSMDRPLAELELGERPTQALAAAGITSVGQVLELMTQGEAALLAIDGFGRKSLADLKKRLRQFDYDLPEAMQEIVV